MNDSLTRPFKSKFFRLVWVAITISNIGSWMNEIGVIWLMTTLTSSSLHIALVQTAISLPFLLLAYPSGVLADIFNRRRILFIFNVVLFLSALVLTFAAYRGNLTPFVLLLLTFMLNISNTMMRPAWAASVPDFVPREDLPSAITLNTLSNNVTRAIGPAIGGYIIYTFGTTVVFAINAISFLPMIYAAYHWQSTKTTSMSSIPVEQFYGALKSGLRYSYNSPEIRTVLVRSSAFFFFASVSWALLPVIAIRQMAMSANGFGLLMTIVGIGTIIGAVLLPRCHRHLSRSGIVTLSSLMLSAVLFLIAFIPNQYTLLLMIIILGVSWILSFSCLSVATQLALPRWVLARGLGVLMVCFGGSMALGSFLWGYLADVYGLTIAIAIPASGLLLSTMLSKRFYIRDEVLNLTASTNWPVLYPVDGHEHNKGPVMVTIRYSISTTDEAEFFLLMNKSCRIRKRDGAYFWQLFNDSENEQSYSEVYMAESWLELLRQQERKTIDDEGIKNRLLELHKGSDRPKVSYQIGVDAI
ncbi:MAG: MFS transporter [Cycloclasticus sp.]|nr:MFS transporter [Cycloclasticus sp.]